jgi:hypothetical protein
MADAFKWGSSLEFHIDNAAGSLAEISDFVNSESIRTAFDMFRVEGLNSTAPERQHGLADVTIPVNGWVNSTTEGIFGPFVGNRTSISKTVFFYNGVMFYTGEFLPTDVEFSGEPATLQTWSCTLAQTGAVTRTSTTA